MTDLSREARDFFVRAAYLLGHPPERQIVENAATILVIEVLKQPYVPEKLA